MWLKAASIRIIYTLIFTVISIISFTNAEDSGTPTSSGASSTSTITTPSPIQTGQIGGCVGWRYVFPTDTCESLVTRFGKYGLTPETLLEWNPAIGPNCTNLIPKYFICVDRGGSVVTTTITSAPPTSTTTTHTPTSTTSTITTPSPIQSGQPSNCIGWAFVRPNDNCDTIIERYYSRTLITRDELLNWNPAIAPDCTPTIGTFLCVQIPGSAPSMPVISSAGSSNTAGPSPTESSSTAAPSSPTGSSDPGATKISRTGIIVGSVIGGVAVAALGSLFALWLVIRERRKENSIPPLPPPKPNDRSVWETQQYAGFNQEGQFVKETRNVFVELPVDEATAGRQQFELPGHFENSRVGLLGNPH
ncbi:hypothetical protein AA313_de0206868 [Arthrobotrys entomopaga]|nr:hypothetical protein AA313_de0206868 [Arthrobotrys entomopaga]